MKQSTISSNCKPKKLTEQLSLIALVGCRLSVSACELSLVFIALVQQERQRKRVAEQQQALEAALASHILRDLGAYKP
jgi:hypothetical protein